MRNYTRRNAKHTGVACLMLSALLTCHVPSAFAAGNEPVKEQTVSAALNYVKSKLGYSIWYNVNDVNINHKVTVVYAKGKSISSILNEILAGQDLEYQIKGKAIIIKRKDATPTHNIAAEKTITGKVSETGSNEPLVGCIIKVKGKKNMAITDINGNYSIDAAPGDELVFSYLQYDSVTKRVGKSSIINTDMSSSSVDLGDVVVTGYQTMKKFNMTGAVNVISPEQIDLRSTNSLESVLEGSVPGLTVYNDEYRIRGGASLRAGNSPLFIVDNFEVEQMPTNMDQIESITVLKDAAATAIWGSRAANGVIVITTKKGKQEAPRISYSGNFKVNAKPNYDNLHRASSADIVNYDRDAFMGGYYFPGYFDYGTNGYSLSQEILKDYLVDDVTTIPAETLAEMDGRLSQLAKVSNKKQIEDNLLHNAFKQNHMISISGGSERINYFLSGSYTGNNSSYKQGDQDNLFEINSRINYKLLDNLTLRTNIYSAFANNKNGYTSLSSDIANMYPYQLLLDDSGNRIYDYSNFNHAFSDSMVKDYGYYQEGKNLLAEVDLANNKTKTSDYKVAFGLDYRVLTGLTLSADYQYEKYQSTTKNLTSKDSYAGRHQINYMAEANENGGLTYHIPNGDILDHSQSTSDAWVMKLGATLNRNFGTNGEHYVNAVGGFEMRSRHSYSEYYRKLGYNDQVLSWQPIDQVALKDGFTWLDGNSHSYYANSYDGFGDIENKELSYFLSATYTYDNRYTGSASLRFDESNLFGASHKYRRNPIYAFGASWNIKNEKFFHFAPVTTLLFRASFGLTGNFDRSGSTTPVMVGRKQYLPAISDYVVRLTTPPNAKLRWERNRSVNLSLDFGVWNRINGTITYYNNYCYDLLGNTLIDPTNGYSSATINAANMRNHGWELELSGDAIKTKDFDWNLRWIFSYNKNKITKNNTKESSPQLTRVTGTTNFVEGYAREAVWSYRWAGLDEKGEPMVYKKNGEKTYDVSELGAEDLEYSGTYQPKYNGSFTSSMRYKQFTLNLLFTYNFGHVFRAEYPSMNPYATSPSLSEKIADRWMKPGDEAHTDIACLPSMIDLWAHTNYRENACMYSSNSIRKGDMIRLREILFNYEMPKSLLKETFMKRLSLTAQLNNVWLWTANKEGYDPEALNPLTGSMSLPQSFSFTAGVKIDF